MSSGLDFRCQVPKNIAKFIFQWNNVCAVTKTAALVVCFAEEQWLFQQSFDAEMPSHVFLTLKVLFCGL